MADSSLGADYFEDVFSGDPDPWGLESRPYEAEKHARTVASLGDRRFRRGLEVGCAGGALTARLADRCEALVALDISRTALDRARRRLGHRPHLAFRQAAFPHDVALAGPFDLIVLSEVAYYWSDQDLAAAAAFVRAHLVPGGLVLLVHWTGKTDYPQTGDGAVTRLWRDLDDILSVSLDARHPGYRLDLWRRP
ncbi:class I SAM-dependent DNA methyltransferase [Brevundimonas sp. PWP3-1b1]|uniref:class I SAM-dependent DNA methyltransferase n=1 Tax=unclassified Brevundimonas TaxID=2622653 RepID=UPI003CF222AB